jgi:N-acetylglucosamine kinase-like BadF-type ATPase
MKYYLGIDGGGTSTTAAVADETGKILGTGEAGPSLYKVAGLDGTVMNIRKAILAAEKKARVKAPSYSYTVLGLSGVDSMKDWKILSALIFKNFKPRLGERFRVVNDVAIVFAAGTLQPHGVALIAGTGSNAYAVGPKGEAYASGLGALLADEGSAYWIGCLMLRAAVKSFDGRGPRTILEQLLYSRFHIRTVRDLVDVVYPHTKNFGGGAFDKTAIAALAPLCAIAARRGDTVARGILYRAAQELADMVIAVAKRAGLAGKAFDCVLSGGVFEAGGALAAPFLRAVRRHVPRIRSIRLHTAPVTGAIRLALQHDDPIK